MSCRLAKQSTLDGGWQRVVCLDCERVLDLPGRVDLVKVKVQCLVASEHGEERAIVPRGVGGHLVTILNQLGVKPDDDSCNCSEVAREMDALGPDGVRAERQRFVDHLNKAYRSLSTWQTLEAAGKSVMLGLVINPLDPAGSLLDLAIQRAEAK